MVEKSIVNDVRNYLLRLAEQGIEISFGIVFGSYASGHAHQWSDIDLVVVSPQFDKTITRENINTLWRIAARTDSRIEPIPCGKRQWENNTSSEIIEIARNEGTPVYLDK